MRMILSPLCLPVSPSGHLIYLDNLRQDATGNGRICPVDGAKTGRESWATGWVAGVFMGLDSNRRPQIAQCPAAIWLGNGAAGLSRSVAIRSRSIPDLIAAGRGARS